MSALHLVRRAVSSLPCHPPRSGGTDAARGLLLSGEFDLWSTMQNRDKRHSLAVLERFVHSEPGATRAEKAAALLHDVGKVTSGLGWTGRVVATIVGPRGRKFRSYHDHESIGAQMLIGVSEQRTVELVSGTVSDRVSALLRDADNV